MNPMTNEPGEVGDAPASSITFVRSDGSRVLYAHIQDPEVEPGDPVRAGQPVAKVGNNGVAWMPHTHVGAWRGDEALQIRFDLNAMGELASRRDG